MNDAIYTALDCATMYLYWTSPCNIVRDVYGEDVDPTYAAEKTGLVRDLPALWGALDRDHRKRLCEAIAAYAVRTGAVEEGTL